MDAANPPHPPIRKKEGPQGGFASVLRARPTPCLHPLRPGRSGQISGYQMKQYKKRVERILEPLFFILIFTMLIVDGLIFFVFIISLHLDAPFHRIVPPKHGPISLSLLGPNRPFSTPAPPAFPTAFPPAYSAAASSGPGQGATPSYSPTSHFAFGGLMGDELVFRSSRESFYCLSISFNLIQI